MRLPWPRTLRSRLVAAAALALAAAALVLFPGRRLVFALAVGTGIGRDALQARVDAVEEKAVRGEPFSADDRAFLVDLYRTIATGGRVVVFARRSGRLLHHYLDGSGADLRLDPEIFTGNAKVRRRMAALRAAAAAAPVDEPVALSSGTFYMPDASQADSVYGLYDGTLRVERVAAPGGARVLRWRAEVPGPGPPTRRSSSSTAIPRGVLPAAQRRERVARRRTAAHRQRAGRASRAGGARAAVPRVRGVGRAARGRSLSVRRDAPTLRAGARRRTRTRRRPRAGGACRSRPGVGRGRRTPPRRRRTSRGAPRCAPPSACRSPSTTPRPAA